jgi:NCAIR mutase (PurE)-related protein
VHQHKLKSVLEKIHRGEITVDQGVEYFRGYPFEELGFATVDHHRALRQGFPEVVFGEGKTVSQIASIVGSLVSRNNRVLVTRLTSEKSVELLKEFPDAEYNPMARTFTLTDKSDQPDPVGAVMVISAGTSDMPVAEEALSVARFFGNEVISLFDVGVSGVHRLLAKRAMMEKARVFIVVAGMEGALPSVVGGLVRRPVIAVPTSVGYGASFGGLAALLGMLNSCASNIAVVNIDNGFGAAYLASLINQMESI